jgi:3-methyladenine DNA glycosylase AlkD
MKRGRRELVPETSGLTHEDAIRKLEAQANPDRAAASQRYFKTGPGEYGEGDLFIGVSMPDARRLARTFGNLPLPEVITLLHSPVHEARMLALLLLCRRYPGADGALREQIYQTYLGNTRFINNWDLVDSSAPNIVGVHLERQDRSVLYFLAESSLLWERRIAIMATFHYVRLGDFSDALQIARRLLYDREDLIHKAVGWMLRETGKRDQTTEERFLKEHCRQMPRTMLRYAIERFPDELRRQYLDGRA